MKNIQLREVLEELRRKFCIHKLEMTSKMDIANFDSIRVPGRTHRNITCEICGFYEMVPGAVEPERYIAVKRHESHFNFCSLVVETNDI